MSENIIIQEGGVGKNLNAIKKIQTAEQGGGSVYWIPEEEIELGTKTITKNGLYKASKSGVDGWSQVLVNVPGGESKTDSDGDLTDEDGNKARVDSDGNPTSDSSGTTVRPKPSNNGGDGTGVTGTNGVSGVNPNDGNEYYVTRDPNTGELVYTKIPSSIRVTKAPDKTHYTAGETIDPSGIIVHAYYKDGTDHGTVLNSELSYDPMIAKQTSEYDSGDETWTANPAYVRSEANLYLGRSGDREFYKTNNIPAICVFVKTGRGWAGPVLISPEPTATRYSVSNSGSMGPSSSIEYDGITWYVNASYHYETDDYAVGDIPFLQVSTDGYAEVLEILQTVNAHAGGQDGNGILVIWHRPTDQKELTDTFNINVTANSSNNNSGSGNESGGGNNQGGESSGESGGGGSHGF